MNNIVRELLAEWVFRSFFNMLERIGFEKLSREEILEGLKNTQAYRAFHKKSEGMETGYCYRQNNKMLIIWSTFSYALQGPKEKDQGWIVIVDPRNPRIFFSHPMNRTRSFLGRLLKQAIAYKELVDNWPVCAIHKEQLYLDLRFDENNSKMYVFTTHHEHVEEKDTEFELIEAPVSEENKKVISFPFLRNKQYRKKNPFRQSQQAIRYMVNQGIARPKKGGVYDDLRYEKHPENYLDRSDDYPITYHEDHSE